MERCIRKLGRGYRMREGVKMLMKRITGSGISWELFGDFKSIWAMAIRLKQIEDILGEDYDLDRLKELVEADRNHLLKEQKTQTNADKIRSMTDEELYDFLCSFASRYTDISSPCAFRAKLFYVMGWLKQPAEED